MIEHSNLSFPEGLAVEFYFEEEAEKQFFTFRDSIYKQGITPVQGLMNDKPHISLAVFPKMNTEKLIRITEEFVKSFRCFSFKLSSIGVFPTPDNVFFLYPVPSQQLLDLHAEFHYLLKKEGLRPSDYYLPGNWVPHCTLEFNLPDHELTRAVLLCKEQFKPITGKITQLGVVAFRPIEYLAQFALKDEC